jgi:hypothetical protein
LDQYQAFSANLWADFYKQTLDTIPTNSNVFIRQFRSFFFSVDWYKIYDLIEFLFMEFPFSSINRSRFTALCNSYLEREMSAWRIVGDQIGRLTSEEEIAAIEEAHTLTDRFAPVATHIRRALALLSDRQNPDYRNSIKEAVSAVESTCRILTGKQKATLGDALKYLEDNGISLHGALKQAFGKLYGYASDEGGVRHSLLKQSTLDYEDAKFMLVSCAAFVNLLRAREQGLSSPPAP